MGYVMIGLLVGAIDKFERRPRQQPNQTNKLRLNPKLGLDILIIFWYSYNK